MEGVFPLLLERAFTYCLAVKVALLLAQDCLLPPPTGACLTNVFESPPSFLRRF